MSAVRYPVRVRNEAVRLREAGWSIGRIRRLLAQQGADPLPSPNTIWCWVNEQGTRRANAHKRGKDRRRRLDTATFRYPGLRSPEWKVQRARSLAAAGLTVAAVATVMGHDFPDDDPVTRYQMDLALTGDFTPHAWREDDAA